MPYFNTLTSLQEQPMALTQDRVIAILSAARRFYNDLQALRGTIRSTIAEIPPDPTTEQCLEAIRSLQFADELATSREADAMLLAAEERHYEISYRKNKRTAEYARRRRAGHAGSLAVPKTTYSISDLDKQIHHEAAEKAMSASFAPVHHTAPVKIVKAKPLDQITTQRPAPPPREIVWTAEDDIIDAKKRSNAKHREFNMKEPYADIFDMSVPLSPEDCREYGFPVPESDNSLF